MLWIWLNMLYYFKISLYISYWLFSIIEWALVEENRECDGTEINKGRFLTVDGCSLACKGIATMFIYGTRKKCNEKGCICWCETSALPDSTCSMIPIENYELYEYVNLAIGINTTKKYI